MKKRFKSFRKAPVRKKRVKKHVSNQVAIKRTGDQIVGTLEADLWYDICDKGLVSKLLGMVERVGWERAVTWLKRQGCNVSGVKAASD